MALIGTGVDSNIVSNVVERLELTSEGKVDVVGHETAIGNIIQHIAPDVEIVDVHVLVRGKADTLDIMNAVWEARKTSPDILSLSLGSSEQASPYEPVSQMLDKIAIQDDIITVVASGNNGNALGSIEAPAGAQQVFAVGSVNFQLEPSKFSGAGPDTTGRIRPETAAIGGDNNEVLAVPTVGILGRRDGVRGTSFSVGFVTGFLASVLPLVPKPYLYSSAALLSMTNLRTTWKDNNVGWGVLDGSVTTNIDKLWRYGALAFIPPY